MRATAILEAACDVIAEQGIEDVRIARIATLAGVSPALVHYHFETREALLAEALEHSFELLGDFRTVADEDEGWTARRGSRWMVDQSLPFPGMGDREWALWLELWGRAARHAELRAVAGGCTAATTRGSPRSCRKASRAASARRRRGRGHAAADRGDRRARPAGARRRPGDAAGAGARAHARGLAEELGIGVEAFDPEGGSR